MFTGIISSIGTIISSRSEGELTVSISCDWPHESVRIGDSIACNGACLTVVEWKNSAFSVQLSAETLARTAPRWGMGEKVNLERAMKLGDSLDGHLVTGHVDGLARIASITREGDSHVVALDAPPALARFLAAKGSVTLDGVSLTVNQVEGARFWVNIIPHTWDVTTLGARAAGDVLNMEIDLIARYVERLLSHQSLMPSS
jgi:riboflavin synthase